MKKLIPLAILTFSLHASDDIKIPEYAQYEKVPDVAQWGDSDWSQVIRVERNISVGDAMYIANEDPQITYFFYTTARRMVLGEQGNERSFRHGDTVFFTGEPTWGSAQNMADGYVKKELIP